MKVLHMLFVIYSICRRFSITGLYLNCSTCKSDGQCTLHYQRVTQKTVISAFLFHIPLHQFSIQQSNYFCIKTKHLYSSTENIP